MSICSLSTCQRPVKSLGLCYRHYMKQWRYGSPEPDHAPRGENVAGERFGTLTVLYHLGKGRWQCICDCGAEVAKYLSGDLKRRKRPTCGSGACRRFSDTYVAVHLRLASDLGSASRHACVDCYSPALHWSYDHADPNELHSEHIATMGIAYSTNPRHYVPRCVPCHKRFDLHQEASTGEMIVS